MITQTLSNHPNITIVHEEVREIPEGPVIIASGPLTSEPLAKAIQAFTDEHPFHFFDAAAPILEKDSIDFSKAYFKSRYDKGEASYINCPMDQQQFDTFYEALIAAECAHLHEFEQEVYFEGCIRSKKWQDVEKRRFYLVRLNQSVLNAKENIQLRWYSFAKTMWPALSTILLVFKRI